MTDAELGLQSTIALSIGIEIPSLGLGVYQSPPGAITERAVEYALNIGYRHIDTARIYANESDVGKALRKSGLPREEVFVTTKLWNGDQGYDSALRACESSLKRLGVSYLDLDLTTGRYQSSEMSHGGLWLSFSRTASVERLE